MKKYIILLAFVSISIGIMAQKPAVPKTSTADSLLNAMGGDDGNGPVAIFKSSRLILSQTTETVKKHNLNFLIIHRFGDFAGKQGGGELYYGLDDIADVYLGFEYGISNNLNIDIGRSTIGGFTDLELKYAILHQTRNGSSPVAITLLGEAGVRPYRVFNTFGDRVSHMLQVMIARQFGTGLSVQLTPTYISNSSSAPFLPAGAQAQYFALLATARIKITNHMGFIVDYGHPFSSFRTTANGFYDPLGFGLEMETGGHVFTINITNAKAVDEINFLNSNQANYSKGQYRIGFTISRMFDFNHK